MKVFDDIKDRDLIYVITSSGDVIECDVIRENNTLLLSDDSYELKKIDISKCLANPCIILNDDSAVVLDTYSVLECIKHIKKSFQDIITKLENYEKLYKEKQI